MKSKYYKIIEKTIEKCKCVLANKHEEYAQCNDHFRNFRIASNLMDAPIPMALGGMLAKHISSVYDLIRNEEPDLEKWDEKICDTINYLLILRAMIELENIAGTTEVWTEVL